MGTSGDVTALLRAWGGGDLEARDRLVPVVYRELRRRAEARIKREWRQTLQTTDLVHEAYLHLVDQQRAVWRNRAQFYAVAAEIMRRILVDRARAHNAAKRSGQWARVTLDPGAACIGPLDLNVLDLDAALQRLATIDERKSKVAELRLIGGLSLEEAADALDLSIATVESRAPRDGYRSTDLLRREPRLVRRRLVHWIRATGSRRRAPRVCSRNRRRHRVPASRRHHERTVVAAAARRPGFFISRVDSRPIGGRKASRNGRCTRCTSSAAPPRRSACCDTRSRSPSAPTLLASSPSMRRCSRCIGSSPFRSSRQPSSAWRSCCRTTIGDSRMRIRDAACAGLSTATSIPPPPGAGLSREALRWLEERGIELVVPIMDGESHLIGALLLGAKMSEERYDESDSLFLSAVAKQTAVIRENLRLRARLSDEMRVRHDVLARLDSKLPDLLKECPRCGACFDGAVEHCSADGETLTLSLPVARTIDARYRLDRLIAKGGMGAVYEAHDLRLHRLVAVKIMPGRAFGRPEALRRFRREARTAARLSHPNIVCVHDVGSLDGGGAYIVMERVQGETLRATLERGLLAPATAADWFEPLLEAIETAHAHGIVHRDLKPENVMGHREPSGALTVKLLDLGLAKPRADDRLLSGTLTMEGIVMGTPDYMSPEQLLGHDVDARTDIFAVGVMILEALTGRRTLDAAVNAGVAGTTALPEPLLELLARCLTPDPSDRPASAAALRGELIPILRGR